MAEGWANIVDGGRCDRESAMLRTSLYSFVFIALSSMAMSPVVLAGAPLHRHGPGVQPRAAAVPGSVTVRGSHVARPAMPAMHRRMAASPFRPDPVFSPFPGPVFFNGIYGAGQTLLLEPAASTRTINLTINRIPVVMGIRRAPEAAPLIYRIEQGGGRHHGAGHRSHADGRRSAPDAKVLSLGEAHAHAGQRHRRAGGYHPSAGLQRREPADTTTPRIIVVRAR
jgi:hypothetical protein